MVALPRSLPRPKMPSVRKIGNSASQKKPDKCVKGTSFSCGATCLPKLTKEGKRTICHMALADNAKIAVSWLARQNERSRILNKDEGRINQGKGRVYTDKEGRTREEDMSSYLTGAKSIRVGVGNLNGKKEAYLEGEIKGGKLKPYRVDGQITKEGMAVTAIAKELQQKAIALEEKANKAEAIAARATHPEQIKRANLLMNQFRGQAKKLRDWITGQGRVKPVKTQEVEPIKKVEKLVTAIAENASQLQDAITQVKPPKAKDSAITNKPEPKPEKTISEQEKPFGDDEIPNVADAIRDGYKLVGQGAYGKVYIKGNQAIKYANIKENEYAIAKKADKLGIGPRVYGRNSTQGDRDRAMSMEFLDGSPLERLAPLNAKSLDGGHFDLVMGLMSKMHTNGISHGDLHTGNMILTGDGLKVIDFGNSRVNDHEEIIQEMLKPSFIRDRPFSDTEITTDGSKLRSRYDSARQEFLDQYGKSGENWPKGKDAEKAIADFYRKVLSGSKSERKKIEKEFTGYSEEEQKTLDSDHKKNLYGIAMGDSDRRNPDVAKKQDESLLQWKNNNVEFQEEKIKKIKEYGLTEQEAIGVAIWLDGGYATMNAAIYDPAIKSDIGESAGINAAKGLKKLQSYKESELKDEIISNDLPLNQGGYLTRNIFIQEDNVDLFLRTYQDAVGRQEFKEPTFFATTLTRLESFDGNIEYRVEPISDGSGQGKMVDEFKNKTFEAEVLFPPYSRFQVLEVRKKGEMGLSKGYQDYTWNLPKKFSRLRESDLLSAYQEIVEIQKDIETMRFNPGALSDEKVAKLQLELGIDLADTGRLGTTWAEIDAAINGKVFRLNSKNIIRMKEL